jgi:dTDP-4-amino-4,6-dideoxygalactose transaminase
MSEYTAAVLSPLLQESAGIVERRKKIWRSLFGKIMSTDNLKQYVPSRMLEYDHNAHIAYLKFSDKEEKMKVLDYMNKAGISCAFHYVPLDVSIAGNKFSTNKSTCTTSLEESDRLLRLPMHNYLTEEDEDKIVSALVSAAAIKA